MKKIDNVNYQTEGNELLRILAVTDVIQPDDFVRPIYEDSHGSYDGGWDTSYKPDGWSGTSWHRADSELTAWVGSTYKEFMVFAEMDSPMHELVRVIDDTNL